MLETECWLGQALIPSSQIPASVSTIFIFSCWTRLTTHPIGTIYLKFGDLGEAEAMFGAVKARCPLWNIRYISPVQVASKLQPENPKASYITIFGGQLLMVARYDNLNGPLDVWGFRRACSPFCQLQPENPKSSFGSSKRLNTRPGIPSIVVSESQILVVAKYDNVH